MSKDTSTNSTLSRAISLLEEIATAEYSISAADLDKRLDIPKPTIHRLIKQLEEQQLITRDLDGRHLLPGSRLRRMAMGTLANESLKAPRHLLLERLAKEVGETCNLTVLDGHELLYYDRVETNWPVRIQLPPGSRLPLHCTASGKLFLALMPPHRRRALLSSLSLEAHTPYTLTSISALEEQLSQIARDRLSTDSEEFIQGMVAIAVPIYDRVGHIQATVGIHAPCLRHSIESLLERAPLMRQVAAELEEIL
ncbi:IclR family transcriptional regulator [Halomonas heilongjiangensis]|uniref:HTH-type transcriptional repressor AllR n=1 Tax=Halomonas heilongjiangensis TaxID=1387883 RepID=A0A2N7THJ4_9GAMM|nr:IclR family transcriptional regulator [Halomonas heilongjiangensis]PMR67661.1 IclR family transcriptional regulator [Halomonas heilongjiangensis]PXX92072.1 IclR family transcriptional regulator [Halomonas heilongjiangensis]